MNEAEQIKNFAITITRDGDKTAVASAHGSQLRLSMSGMDPTLGFTAPETVIAGYGACVMTNIGKEAKARSLRIDDVRIEFSATKRNEPLGIKNLKARVTLKSPEDRNELKELLAKAVVDGTATNALKEGMLAAFDFAFD